MSSSNKNRYDYDHAAKEWVSFSPRQRATLIRSAKRNDRCPCGSGKKFKHCHMPRFTPKPATEGDGQTTAAT